MVENEPWFRGLLEIALSGLICSRRFICRVRWAMSVTSTSKGRRKGLARMARKGTRYGQETRSLVLRIRIFDPCQTHTTPKRDYLSNHLASTSTSANPFAGHHLPAYRSYLCRTSHSISTSTVPLAPPCVRTYRQTAY